MTVGVGVFRLSDRRSHPRLLGLVDPIPPHDKQDMTGLGKYGQDAREIENTVSQRRELASERLPNRRAPANARKERCVSSPVIAGSSKELMTGRTTLLAGRTSNPRSREPVFEKQFKNVAQDDERCNSYAHHPKIRFKETRSSERRLTPKGRSKSGGKRKGKERRKSSGRLPRLPG